MKNTIFLQQFFQKVSVSGYKDFKIIQNILFILFGFLGGNLCGSFFYIISLAPFIIILCIVLCLEILAYIYYKTVDFTDINQKIDPITLPVFRRDKTFKFGQTFFKFVYLFKIGFIFGIFVDAFKVGS